MARVAFFRLWRRDAVMTVYRPSRTQRLPIRRDVKYGAAPLFAAAATADLGTVPRGRPGAGPAERARRRPWCSADKNPAAAGRHYIVGDSQLPCFHN